jgi:glycosyltransferase involved in cell wall biosynthesis
MWVLTQDDYEVACSWNPDKARLQQSPGFGCRIDQFDPARFSPEWRAERKRELAIDPDAKVLIFVGRLAAFKGFDRVVHTFQSLGDRVAKVHLLIVGGRDDLHSSGLSVAEWNALEQHSNVTLAGWQDDTAQWLALSDLCLFPSAREGMPVCLMEALSMGVPVVTTDSRGCRDVVTHEVDGLVLADGSVESMTQACALLFKDANRLQRYAEAALLGRAKWSRKHFIDEYMVEFEAVVSPAAID